MPISDNDLLSHLVETYLPIVKPSVKGAGGILHKQVNTEEWLMKLFPQTFKAPLASFHKEFWRWMTSTFNAKKEHQPFPKGNAFFAIWSRAFGKSSHAEIAPIAEAAWMGEGLCLYVSGTQDLANRHLAAIEELLLSDSIQEHYPLLGKPIKGVTGQTKNWKQEFLQTSAGYSIVAVGLDVGIRGLKVGTQRPSLIVLDDIDEREDSPATALRKLERLTYSILPAGDKQSVIVCAQNLIHRHGVINQIYENKVSALTSRYISGPHKAVEGLVTKREGIRDIIIAGKANWDYLDIKECQRFIDNSGLNAFLSEYQHDLQASLQGLILPEYNEEVHVISWSQFAKVYGMPFVPSDWAVEVGHDWGSTGVDKHPGIVSFIATSSESSALPGISFLFAGLTFDEGILIDDAAAKMIGVLKPDDEKGRLHDLRKQVESWRMSHEAKSERDTYRVKFDLPFQPCDHHKTAGIPQLRHFLRIDYSKDHPFKRDVKGASTFYWIVDDDQLEQPRDDKGLFRHRQEIVGWRWKPIQLRDSGMPADAPTKWMDDAMNSLMMISQQWQPRIVPLTIEEKRERELHPSYQQKNIDKQEYSFAKESNMFMRDFKLQESKDPDAPDPGASWSEGIYSTKFDEFYLNIQE